MNPADDRRLERLENAFAAFVEFDDAATPEERERFLDDHEDVRDLLEPMIEGDDGPTPPAPSDDETMLGDFRLLREIGRGGMGVVYEGWQVSLRRRVAVKVLPPRLVMSPRAIARFRREAEIMGLLDHPALVKVISVGQERDVFYYAMELVDGTPLSERTASVDGRLDHRAAARLVCRIAEALEHVHRLGVVHRDVKPANILVRADGSAVLTDFGLARHDALPSMTMAGDFAGTPYYAAPEQAAGGSVDARTDVFALGATLYELLTGVRPFADDNLQRVLELIRKSDPVEPSRTSSNVPRDLSAIVMKALAKAPRDRYQSADELADDLRAYDAGRPVRARPPTAPGRLVRWARREPLKAALAAVVGIGALVVSALAGYLLSTAAETEIGAITLHEREVESRLESGFAELALGVPDRALREFEAARALSPASVEALAGIALAHIRRGEPLGAVDILTDAVGPDGSPGLRRLLQRARTVELDETAEAPPESDTPESSLEHFVVGLTELERGRRDDDPSAARSALRHLRRAVMGSGSARALYYTQLALAAGDAGDAEVAVEVADALERLWPDAFSTWFHISYALVQAAPERAVRAGERALELGLSVDNPKALSGLHNNIGTAWSNAGDLDRAIASWRRALELDDRNARACLNLGMAARRSRPDDARRHLQKAVEIDPGYAKAWRALGESWLQSGDHAAALAAFERAVDASPRQLNSRYAAARELSRAGRHEDAVSHLRAAVDVDSTRSSLWYALGNALRRTGELAAAAEALERAAALDPSNPARHVNYAGVLLALHRPDDAVVELQAALALSPRDPKICFNLGLAMLSARRYENGQQHLVAAIERAPETYGPLIRESLLQPDGDLHRLRYDAALCRAALVDDPGAPWAHETLVTVLDELDDQLALRLELCRWAELRADDDDAWRALAEHCLAPALPDSLRSPAAALRAARRAGDARLVRAAEAAVRSELTDR